MRKNATSCADHRKSRHREKGRQATGPLWLHLAAQAAERETLQSTDWIHISKKKWKRFHMNVWIMNIFAWGFFHCVFFFVTSQASFAKCCQLAGQKPGRPVWFGPTTRGANSLCFNAVYRMHPVGTGLGCEHQNINLSVFFLDVRICSWRSWRLLEVRRIISFFWCVYAVTLVCEVLKLFCSVRYEDYELYMRLLGEASMGIPHLFDELTESKTIEDELVTSYLS